MNTSLRAAAALTAGLTAAAAVPGHGQARVDLMPHRAAYVLSLPDGGGSGAIDQVKGGLVMEWRHTCEGWISQQQLAFVADADGNRFAYDVRFSSWESIERDRMRFQVRTFEDGELVEEARGQAFLQGPGQGGQAAFDLPETEVLDLPRGTIFPTEHMRAMIEGAEEGKMVVSRPVFDGSGLDGLSEVTAVIGEMVNAPLTVDGDGKRGWPVSLAYHLPGTQDDLPEFEMGFVMSERGVLSDLRLDYGDFVLQGDLEQVEALPEHSCE